MKRKSWIALGCSVLVTTSVLAGCGGGGAEPAAESSGDPGKAGEKKEPVKISITVEGSGLPTPQEDWIKQELDKRLNIDVSLTAIQGLNDYLNQMKVRSAAGNMPDLMMVDLVTLNDFAQKGLLLDLTPHLDSKLKQAKDFMGANLLKKGMVGGKYYAITRIADVPFSSYWIRKDWLNALNLKEPTTLEELYDVAKAFTEKDPDGNGKKDTYGFTGTEFSTFAPIFGAYGMGGPGSGIFYTKDKKLMNAYYDPAMPEALKYIQRLIGENLVDPQLMTNKGTMARDQAIQGKAGIAFMGWTDIGKQEFIQQYKTVNPKAEWVQIAPPKGPGGQYDSAFDAERPSRLYVIPKSAEKNPEKLQKIFELLNYVSSKEGNALVMYGIEGRHYNMKDGKIELTEAMAKEGNYFHYYQMTGRPNEEYLTVKFPQEEAYIKFALKLPRLNSIDSAILPPAGYNAADADRYAKEELVKFVYGKRPLSEYPAFLKTMEDTFKYKLLIDEAQKRAKELELVK
ncbi:putative aldouronate transport system substrate-binding protein [Paenibacillus sp. UNCCL117]|uniref:extracellular solute-binding protein n=1 Tax=unclassified Paenibacillus TaxID=185978 RepID=UPI00088B3430|nr:MULTISPECIES: extracellular solute-binding protein [unclassified Paenibacillus]SDD08165.1 putative aldouronate transport system substrate-binding protein [Paenibacillus sp. cl123]SFW31282.1 putative aldouronate transport system substrate-binding protein [Paenibacillus sp. UNCCL117]